jgi:sterol desaturase/sphingolipid hydroxylase (fatty acid hydroxylase superfamily)
MMINLYDMIHEWLMQQGLLPLLYNLSMMEYADEANVGLDWMMLGCLQILLIALVIRPLERGETHELFEQKRRSAAIRNDIFYTLIHRLGIFQFTFFYLFSGFLFSIDAHFHDLRFMRLNVEDWFPILTQIPWVSFIIYLIIFDGIDYIYHRASHRFQWWWKLHALHHSQRHMTAWTDNRNNILDDLMRALVFAVIALVIGVGPSQFLLLSLTTRLIQSWQHANFQTDLGWAKYLLVSPAYHRLHHALGLGYELLGKPGVLGGCNFGVLFPWWDMLGKTVIFPRGIYMTGVEDFNPSTQIMRQQWQSIRNSYQAIIAFLKGIRT